MPRLLLYVRTDSSGERTCMKSVITQAVCVLCRLTYRNTSHHYQAACLIVVTRIDTKKHLLPLFCCAFREEFRTKASYCMVSHVTTAFIYSQCRTPYLAETFPTPGTSGSDRIDRRCACAGWWRNFRSICTSIRRSPPDPGERISTNRQTYIIHQQSIDHHTASNWSRDLSKWHAVTNVNNILKYVGKICHYYMFVVSYRNNKRFTWFSSVSVAKSNDTECKTSNHATNNNSKFTR